MSSSTLKQTPVVAIRLRVESEEKLRDMASNAGLSLESFLEEIIEREAAADTAKDLIAEATDRIRSRTPDQLREDRERILGLTPEPRPLPECKTLFDVVEATWPGDESEERVRASLVELS